MLSKILALLLTLSFICPAYSNVNHAASLKAAFDELNYSLTVEWDQKDEIFQQTQMKKFEDSLKELNRQGLSNAEMMELLTAELKNEQLAKNLEEAFRLVSINKMTPEQARELLNEVVKKSYASGSNWISKNSLITVGAILTAVLIVVAIVVISVNVIQEGTCIGPVQELCTYPNADLGDYKNVTCATTDMCTGEVSSSYSYVK
jgi:Glu-tRNA(Gln) amidotransferase subunit E-like FAD-binding protein